MKPLLAALAAFALAACGSTPEKKAEGPDPCKLAQADLATRLGPEFDRVVTGRRLALAPPGGCALVYLQKDEELAEEVEGEGAGSAVVDQLLAVALPDGTGKQALSLVGASAMAPGAVLLTLDAADFDGDGTAELVVAEAAGDYQGLRIFQLPPSGGEPIEVFADHLKVKTPEGVEIAARWSADKVEGAAAIVLDGAGTKKIYRWNRSEKKFAYDEAATQAAMPKPPPPPEAPVAPVTEAPPKPLTAAEKKAAEKAEKAAAKAAAAAEKKAEAERKAALKAEKKAALEAEKQAAAEEKKAAAEEKKAAAEEKKAEAKAEEKAEAKAEAKAEEKKAEEKAEEKADEKKGEGGADEALDLLDQGKKKKGKKGEAEAPKTPLTLPALGL